MRYENSDKGKRVWRVANEEYHSLESHNCITFAIVEIQHWYIPLLPEGSSPSVQCPQ